MAQFANFTQGTALGSVVDFRYVFSTTGPRVFMSTLNFSVPTGGMGTQRFAVQSVQSTATGVKTLTYVSLPLRDAQPVPAMRAGAASRTASASRIGGRHLLAAPATCVARAAMNVAPVEMSEQPPRPFFDSWA